MSVISHFHDLCCCSSAGLATFHVNCTRGQKDGLVCPIHFFHDLVPSFVHAFGKHLCSLLIPILMTKRLRVATLVKFVALIPLCAGRGLSVCFDCDIKNPRFAWETRILWSWEGGNNWLAWMGHFFSSIIVRKSIFDCALQPVLTFPPQEVEGKINDLDKI